MSYYQRIIQGQRGLRMFLIKFPTQSKFSYEIRSSYLELIQSSPENPEEQSTPPLWCPHSISFGAAAGLGRFGVVVLFLRLFGFSFGLPFFFFFSSISLYAHCLPSFHHRLLWRTLCVRNTLKNLNVYICTFNNPAKILWCTKSLSLILVQRPKLYIWWANLTTG